MAMGVVAGFGGDGGVNARGGGGGGGHHREKLMLADVEGARRVKDAEVV